MTHPSRFFRRSLPSAAFLAAAAFRRARIWDGADPGIEAVTEARRGAGTSER